jgi:hypothetical protein
MFQKIAAMAPVGKRRSFEKNFSGRTYFIPTVRGCLELLGFEIIDNESITLDLWSFDGREIFPRGIGVKINRFVDHFSNVPIFESFGGWYMIMAKKKIC